MFKIFGLLPLRFQARELSVWAIVAVLSCIFLTSMLSFHRTVPDVASVVRQPRCTNFYIDLGTNNALSIADFVNGSVASADGEVRPLIEYRDKERMDVSSFCIFGIEPNPAHTKAHRQIEAMYGPQVRHIEIFSETAAGPSDGNAELAIDEFRGKFPAWGSSVMKDYVGLDKGNRTARIRTMNLQNFFENRVVSHLPPGGKVLVRIDVEGAEFVLLRDLVSSGIACNYFNLLVVEWHDMKFKTPVSCARAMLQWMLSNPKCKTGWKREGAPAVCDGWNLSDQFSTA